MSDVYTNDKPIENDIFTIEPVQLQFDIKTEIKSLVVKDNLLSIVLITGTIYRIDLNNPEEVITLQLPIKNNVSIDTVFVDTLGFHYIAKTNKNDYYYISKQDSKIKHLSKIKGLNITSLLFFDDFITESSTGPVLLSAGNHFFEYHIEKHNEISLKQVSTFKDTTRVLCSVKEGSNHIINVLIGKKLIQFAMQLSRHGNNVFSNLSTQEQKVLLNNQILFAATNGNQFAFIATSDLGSEQKIVFGNISSKSAKDLSTIRLKHEAKSIVITKYYILVLTDDNTLLVFNQLNHKLQQHFSLDSYLDSFHHLTIDESIGTYWSFSNAKIYEIVSNDESDGIWKLLLEKRMFDQALQLLDKSDDQPKYNLVLSIKGEYLLKTGEYKKAAEVLGKTEEPFENIALKFLKQEDQSILRTYLTTKLSKLPKHYQGQKIVLTSWIVESYIEGLNDLDKTLMFTTKVNNEKVKQRDDLDKEFHKFLNANISSIDKETIYEIINSHNRKSDLLKFANSINDYQYVLKNCIQSQKWEEALKVLLVQGDCNLIYQSATVLIINEPAKTVDVWIRMHEFIDPLKLIPALLTYNKNIAFAQDIKPQFNEALRYLNFLIYEQRSTDVVIHNTFFTILITYPSAKDENYILKHLEKVSNNDSNLVTSEQRKLIFDYDFILRLCFKFNKVQAAINLYSYSNKFENAIKLALDNNLLQVAIRVAEKPLGKDRKKLWLMIAKKFIQSLILNDKFIEENKDLFEISITSNEDKNYGILIKFLISKCDLIGINDLLPLFPDFIIIDDFKDDIVKALTDTSSKISTMSLEMESSLNESEKIKSDIKNFKKDSFQLIEPYESCLLCHKLLASRKFFAFPCFHSFHQDCLAKEIVNSNDYKLKTKIYKIQKAIKQNSGNSLIINELKNEIDELLSTSCYFCSDIKINQIDEPLIKPGTKDDWEL